MSTELLSLHMFFHLCKTAQVCIFHMIVSMNVTTHISIFLNRLVELDKVIYHTLLYLEFCSIFREKSTYVSVLFSTPHSFHNVHVAFTEFTNYGLALFMHT